MLSLYLEIDKSQEKDKDIIYVAPFKFTCSEV